MHFLRFHEYFYDAVGDFHFRTVTASAESVGGSTPGARVTWSTTIPPECVTSVRVEFKTTSRGPVVATYNTTNTSETEVIQTGLQCGTYYHIGVEVTAELRPPGGMPTTQILSLPELLDVQVFVGGNETVCMQFQSQQPYMVVMPLHRYTSPS